MVSIGPLTEEHRQALRRLRRRAVGRVAERAQMVLLSARGYTVAEIAEIFEVGHDVVRTWLGRYQRDGPDGLRDRPRPGRPPKDPPAPAVRGPPRAGPRHPRPAAATEGGSRHGAEAGADRARGGLGRDRAVPGRMRAAAVAAHPRLLDEGPALAYPDARPECQAGRVRGARCPQRPPALRVRAAQAGGGVHRLP